MSCGSAAWAYKADDSAYSSYERERLRSLPTNAADRSAVRLACFAGRAEEGKDTHGAQRSSEVPGCGFVVESILRRRANDSSIATSDSVFTQLGLRPADVDRLQRDGILVLDGMLDPSELRQLSSELRHQCIRERLGASPNEASSKSQKGDAAARATVRSDRLLFLGTAYRQAAASELPVLRHAERLLREYRVGNAADKADGTGEGEGAKGT